MSNTPASGTPSRMHAFWRMALWVLLVPLILFACLFLWFTPLMLALPLPYAIWLARGGSGRYAMLPLLVAIAALGFILPPVWALGLFMLAGALGLWLAFKPGRMYQEGIAIAFGTSFAAILGALAVLFLVMGDPVNAWMNAMAQQLQTITPESPMYELLVRAVQADLFMQDPSVLPQTLYSQLLALPQPQLIKSFLSLMESVIRAQLPILIIQYVFVGGIGCYCFGCWWLNRGKTGLLGLKAASAGKVPPLRLWALPKSANWGMLALLVTAYILSAYATSDALNMAASVIYQLATLVFSVIGLATLDFFMVRKNAPVWLRILTAIAVALIFPVILSLLGILEQLFRVRLGYRLQDSALAGKDGDTPPDESATKQDDNEHQDDTPHKQ